VSIGAGAYLGSGTTLTNDVPDNALVVTRAPERVIEKWGTKFRNKNKGSE
jgi:bifunctional UDP-N-acetylglucosamine pyrophosphorylase/glucosamine-1-phosphate N-acetyltransferase